MYTNKCYRISEQQGGIITQNKTFKRRKTFSSNICYSKSEQ